MRAAARMLPLLLAGVPLLVWACASRQTAGASRAYHDVNIALQCQEAVTATVTPWRKVVPRGDTVRWIPKAGADSLVIDTLGAWPLQALQPRASQQGGTTIAAWGAIQSTATPGQSLPYKITAFCRSGEETFRVIIDPDVIIGEERMN